MCRGIALVTDPDILFLDEPTSGLVTMIPLFKDNNNSNSIALHCIVLHDSSGLGYIE